MQGAGGDEELRALQARAYGRGGGLTDAEAARLVELTRRPSPPDAALVGAHLVEPADEPPAAATTEVASSVREPGVSAEAGPEDVAAARSASPSLGHRPGAATTVIVRRWAVGAIAAALVLGIGVGWLLFADRRAPRVELTSAQELLHAQLVADGDYDEGSITPLAVEEGVAVWFATRAGGEYFCLLLSDGDAPVPACENADGMAERGLYASLITEQGDQEREVNAHVLLAADGTPAVAVSSYVFEPGERGIPYASEEEERTAGLLAERGFDARTLWVVGYDGDVPIWTATELESQRQCLVYGGAGDAGSGMACADAETLWGQGASLVLEDVDGEGTRVELRFTENGAQFLVITRDGGVDATEGTGGDVRIELGGEHGDPIEVTPPRGDAEG